MSESVFASAANQLQIEHFRLDIILSILSVEIDEIMLK